MKTKILNKLIPELRKRAEELITVRGGKKYSPLLDRVTTLEMDLEYLQDIYSALDKEIKSAERETRGD